MDHGPSTRTPNEPVKIVLERRVKPGMQAEFEEWTRELIATANRSPALEGSSVLTAEGGLYFILLRFGAQHHLDRWLSSPAVEALLRRAETLATATDEPVVRTGLETWFTLPGLPKPATAPPKWKMALVTWLALLPQVLILGFVVPASLPVLLKVALSTAIPVSMLTWVIMPRATKLLYRWLYAPRAL